MVSELYLDRLGNEMINERARGPPSAKSGPLMILRKIIAPERVVEPL
jgi:hypothetical protein